jgi:HlyD family secretion protein
VRTIVLAGSGQAGSQRLRHRKFLMIGVAALAAIASVGGLLVSTTIKSPAELAAQSAPPALTQLTAPVTRQVIISTVLTQGLVKPPPRSCSCPGRTAAGWPASCRS